MRKAHLPLLFLLLPALSNAGGSRWIETSGQVPTVCAATDSAGDGLALKDVEACRATIRGVDAGANINGGYLVPYYCEVGSSTLTGWHEGPSTARCTLESCSKVDGGCARTEQTCEWTVINGFGRVAVVAYAIVGNDGGTGKGLMPDAGWNAGPVVRLECSGKSLGTPAGATP